MPAVKINSGKGTIRVRLGDVMEARGISIAELSRRLGPATSTISRWKNDDVGAFVSIEILAALCAELQCEVGDILLYEPNGNE